MDESFESTVIAKSLKDLNQFLGRSSRSQLNSPVGFTPRQRLDFDSSLSRISPDSRTGLSTKRKLDSMTGLDITKKFREKDTELADAKATIARLGVMIQNMETANQKAQLEHETAVELLKRQQMKDKELVDDLHHKLKQLQGREREIQAENQRIKQECSVSLQTNEKKMLHIQSKYSDQSEKLQTKVSQLQQTLLELEKDCDEKTSQVKLLESHVKNLEELVASYQKKLKESGQELMDSTNLKIQLENSTLRIKELESQLMDLQRFEKNQKLFEQAVRNHASMEKKLQKLAEDNKMYRTTVGNSLLLEEKLNAAEQQVKLLEERCNTLSHFQAESEKLQKIVSDYESVLLEELKMQQIPPLSELRSSISCLKEKDTVVSDSISQLKESIKSLEVTGSTQEQQIVDLTKQLEQQSTVIQQATLKDKRLRRKLNLVVNERNSLKGIIASYESETTLNPSAVENERVQKLEALLEASREEIKQLESDVEQAQHDIIAMAGGETYQSVRDGASKEKIEAQEARITELQQENEKLQLKLEHLELKGEYDPTKTKILTFKGNPAARAQEKRNAHFESLEKENEALKERIRLMVEGEQHNITEVVGMKANLEQPTSHEVKDLQGKLSALETRNLRLIEVFKKKSQEMREIVYRLTGYRVDLIRDNHYQLSNMYAESRDDLFLFEQTPSGELLFLETDFSSSLEELIATYLHQKESYPAFLSAVTLDLFHKQTVVDDPASVSSSHEEEGDPMEDDEGMEEEDDDDDEEVDEEEERAEDGDNEYMGEEPSDDDGDGDDEDDDDLIVIE